MTQEELQRLLKKYNLKANHTLGQHFLMDDMVFDKMITAAEIGPADTVLEVGPGIGNLTARLAQTGAQVVAVEKDRSFQPLLTDIARQYSNIEVHFADILKFDIAAVLALGCSGQIPSAVIARSPALGTTRQSALSILGVPKDRLPRSGPSTGPRNDKSGRVAVPGYKVVANLPYYLTGIFMQRVLRQAPRPTSVTVLIQREVAENMVAGLGKMNLLALSVQLVGVPRIVTYVPAKSFYPAPKVESAVITVDIPKVALHPDLDEQRFFRVARACFSGKRKQIHNTLVHNLGLDKITVAAVLAKAGLEASVRPQHLHVNQFIELARAVAQTS